MKKFTAILLFMVIATTALVKAQIQKGNVMVGGNFADINLGLNSSHNFNLNVTPKAAWFIQDNVALGGYVNLGVQTAKGSSTTFSYGAGALGRYYTGSDVSILQHGRIFGEANVGFGGVNISNGFGNTNGLELGIGPGFAYFVTPNIGLETLLKFDGLTGFGNQTFQGSLDLSFGLQIYLPGKSTAAQIKKDMK